MTAAIVPIVEGQGEVAALRVIIRRITAELTPAIWPRIVHPWRHERGKLLRPGEIERAVEAAATVGLQQSAYRTYVLVLIDADDGCPKTLAPELCARAAAARSDVRTSVVLANREFEAWFLASAGSLAGAGKLIEGTQDHPHPEDVQGAKEWLTKRVPGSRIYSPTADQASFAAAFDMYRARERSRSFRKFWREIERMLV